jgi:hypothetical protein
MGENPSALKIGAETVGKDLWGAAGIAANAAANIPHGVLAGADYWLQKAAGVEHPLPTHALEVTNTTPEMQEFQHAVGQSPLVQNPVSQAVIGKVKELAAAHPEAAADIANTLNLLPGLGAAREIGAGLDAVSAARQAAADAAESAPATTPVEIARAAGYKLKPTEAGGGTIAQATEGLTGSKRLENQLIEHNQGVTNRLAAQEVGLDPTKTITDQALNKAKQPHNAVYDEVGKTLGTLPTDDQFRSDIAAIGSPGGESFAFDANPQIEALKSGYGGVRSFTADDALAKMRQLRRDASQNLRAPYNPELQAKGSAQQAVADALEGQMDRAAQASTQPDLLDRFRTARTQLAKIANVQNALDEQGNVSARALGKAADKGAPLTGRLGIIADTARAFPNVTGDLTALKQRSGFTVPELAFATTEGLGSMAAGHPGAAALGLGAIAARHLGRAVLGSDLYQNALGRVAEELGPDSRLGEYFARPRAAEAAAPAPQPTGLPFTEAQAAAPGELSPAQAVLASRLAGDLQLAPEAPGHGLPFEPSDIRLGDLQAATPPVVHGDIPFTASRPLGTALAGNMELAQQQPRTGGISFTPGQPNPRAAGMSETTERGTLFPELRAVRSGRDVGQGLSLEQPPQPPARPLALPAPIRGPMAVDQAGRVGASPGDVAAYRQAMGLDELGPGVRQPAANPSAEQLANAQRGGAIPSAPAPSSGTINPGNPQHAAKAIRQLVGDVQRNPSGNAHAVVRYASEVHPSVVDAFKQGGVDVSGYSHVIDSSAVRHVLNRHGSVSELQKGQLPVTKEDFAQLPNIVTNPDAVQYAGKTKIGRDAVQYLKRVGNDVVVVEEARTGRKQLALTSMWKVARHEPMSDLGAPTPAPTSETLGGTLPHADGPDSTTKGSQGANSAPGKPKNVPRATSQVYAQRSEAVPAPADRAGFLSRFAQLSQESPTNPAGRLFSKNVSVELQPEPTDEHTVHVEDLRALTTGQGHGAAALKKITGLADRHGVRLTLDAHPLDKGGISKEKLVQFYQNHGFQPAANEWRPNLMVREPGGAK